MNAQTYIKELMLSQLLVSLRYLPARIMLHLKVQRRPLHVAAALFSTRCFKPAPSAKVPRLFRVFSFWFYHSYKV